MTRTCIQCGAEKDGAEFFSHAATATRGKRWESRCKPCYAASRKRYAAVYRAANAERIAARRKRHRLENRDAIREKDRARYDSAKAAEWGLKRREDPVRKAQHDAAVQEWRRTHAEHLRHYRRDYVARRKAVVYAANHAYRARKAAAVVEPVDLERVLERDGLWCYLCTGEVLPADVSFDHVIPLSRGGAHAESNLRVTHSGCNSRKHAKLLEEL